LCCLRDALRRSPLLSLTPSPIQQALASMGLVFGEGGEEQGQLPFMAGVCVLRSVTGTKQLCIGQYDKFFEEYCLLPISFHHIGYPRCNRDI
jgi:hypothetical protein